MHSLAVISEIFNVTNAGGDLEIEAIFTFMQSDYIKKLEHNFPSLFTTLLVLMQNYCNYSNGLFFGGGGKGGSQQFFSLSHPVTSKASLTCTGRCPKQETLFTQRSY